MLLFKKWSIFLCLWYSVSLSSSDSDFEFTPDSGCILDLPHALGEAFDANAASILHLVPDVGNDVLWREMTSKEGEEIDQISCCWNIYHASDVTDQKVAGVRTSDECRRRKPGLASYIRSPTYRPEFTHTHTQIFYERLQQQKCKLHQCSCVLTLAGQWGKPFILANTRSPGFRLSPGFPGILIFFSPEREREQFGRDLRWGRKKKILFFCFFWNHHHL